MKNALLTVNVGSSSIKCAVYSADCGLEKLYSGHISRIGHSARFSDDHGNTASFPASESTDHSALLAWLLAHMENCCPDVKIVAAGHRVVHGGVKYTQPVEITPCVTDYLQLLIELAPNHEPHNLAGINAVGQHYGELAQVACFDTSFHRTQPAVAQLFPLNRELTEEGIIRYGFHGLSYAYISSILPDHLGEKANGRIVILHLGHGCSACALKGGKSIATTTGFSAMGGLMMGKRSGDLDPGILLHLLSSRGFSSEQLGQLLNHESGLLGMSGESDDMQVLLESASETARQAIDLFVYRITQGIGSMVALLEGLDAIVFTAGIGENSAEIRARIASSFGWLGVKMDKAANDANRTLLSTSESEVVLLRLQTDEEIVIAENTLEIIKDLKQQ